MTSGRLVPTILVVDDDQRFIRGLREVLKTDYSVVFRRSGQEALAACVSAHPPDLVLLDLGLPDMDGYEVMEQLTKEPLTRGIPVIILTGRMEKEEEAIALHKGAADYIPKDFHPGVLKARVERQIVRKRERDELEPLTYRDGLTRIYNRRKFDVTFEHEWYRAMRNRTSLALVMIDIDHFKAFNDHYLHQVGDECLRRVAHALAASIHRAGDFVARYGGEEFSAVLPDTDLEGALMVAERMREGVSGLAIPHLYSSTTDHVTVSVGIACRVPGREEDPQQLLGLADIALYRAKANGRNRIVVNDPVTPSGTG